VIGDTKEDEFAATSFSNVDGLKIMLAAYKKHQDTQKR
jgi:hypothetical protein